MEQEKKTKGIWIQKENSLYYSTWLRERKKDIVKFISFEHPYNPMYLGSVGFLDLAKINIYSVNLKNGLFQNKFYPFGGTVKEIRPKLVEKGLARKIEFEIAKDLLRNFSKDTPIIIGAISDNHLKYCERVGITPFAPMSLEDYTNLLDR
jgi:hypothetical protein